MLRLHSISPALLALLLIPVVMFGVLAYRHQSGPTATKPPPGTIYVSPTPSNAHKGTPEANLAAQYLEASTPVQRLTAAPNGPGLIVCDPVTDRASIGLSAFGIGCGRWLHLAAAGEPALDQTPNLDSCGRAVQELHRRDLALTASQAFQLAHITGVTHAAVAELSGDAGNSRLVYQLWDLSRHKQVGAPIAVTGSEDQIVRRLPSVAHELDTALGVASPAVTSEVGATASELAFLGQRAWPAGLDLKVSDLATLKALAARTPLAGLAYLASGGIPTRPEQSAVLARLYQQAPQNTLVLVTLTRWDSQLVQHNWSAYSGLLQEHPNNYLLNLSSVMHERAGSTPIGGVRTPTPNERKAAEAVVRSAFPNPESWLTLGRTISDQAQAVRGGVVYSEMDSQQQSFVEQMYPQWVAAVQRATEMDPGFAKAWLRLSTAAAFAGEEELADRAFWKAIHLDSGNVEAYQWGLQLYQPKWFDDDAKLARVAAVAAAAHYTYAQDALSMARSLQANDFPELSKRLLSRLEQEYRLLAARNPADARTHYGLAGALSDEGRYDEAAAEYRDVLKLRPEDVNAQYYLAVALDKSGHSQEALPVYQAVVRLAPEYAEAHYALSKLYKKLGNGRMAAEEARQAVRHSSYLENFQPDVGALLASGDRKPAAPR